MPTPARKTPLAFCECGLVIGHVLHSQSNSHKHFLEFQELLAKHTCALFLGRPYNGPTAAKELFPAGFQPRWDKKRYGSYPHFYTAYWIRPGSASHADATARQTAVVAALGVVGAAYELWCWR